MTLNDLVTAYQMLQDEFRNLCSGSLLARVTRNMRHGI